MAFDLHTVDMMGGSVLSMQDRLRMGLLYVANAAGTGNGVAVTTAIVLNDLPAQYGVFIGALPSGVSGTITGTAQSGFNLVLTPASGATLAAGTTCILVLA